MNPEYLTELKIHYERQIKYANAMAKVCEIRHQPDLYRFYRNAAAGYKAKAKRLEGLC